MFNPQFLNLLDLIVNHSDNKPEEERKDWEEKKDPYGN
jgi:hypothetical protein